MSECYKQAAIDTGWIALVRDSFRESATAGPAAEDTWAHDLVKKA